MFAGRIHLFKMFGFDVKADTSWFIILFFLIWTLAFVYFPTIYEDLGTASYVVLGVSGTLGLFLSIIIHEFCHALAAKRYGLPMKGITLWVFGGIAEMEQEPANAKQEFIVAAAGPLASFILAGILWGVSRYMVGNTIYLAGTLNYLWQINLVLGIFNLIPAFPLDGGRILRSLLWQWKGKIEWATKITSNIGSGFGVVFMFVGVLGFFTGDFIGGVWYFFIGLFIRWAAKMSYSRLRINQALAGEPIHKFMTEVHPISSATSISDAIENYVYKYHLSTFPVVDSNENLVGILEAQAIRDVPEAKRSTTIVGEVVSGNRSKGTIDASTDASDAISRLFSGKIKSLVVLRDDIPVGSIDLNKLLKIVSLKLEISGEEDSISPDMKLSEAI